MRRKRSTSALGRFSLVPGVGGGGESPDPDQGTYYVLATDQDETLTDDDDAELTGDPWP